jgi:hypothetical protein
MADQDGMRAIGDPYSRVRLLRVTAGTSAMVELVARRPV